MEYAEHGSLRKYLNTREEELDKEQASYIGVKVEGPYKPEYYRY